MLGPTTFTQLPFTLGAAPEDWQALGLRGLNCGSFDKLQAGCLNVDQARFFDEYGRTTAPGHVYQMGDGRYFLSHDLRQPFPLPDASFDWIFSEHFIEHLSLADGIVWMREMHRLLGPGGLLRVTTPDMRRYIEGYLDPERRFFDAHRARLSCLGPIPTRRAWMVNQIFYHWEHRWLYDLEELTYVATEAGFGAGNVRQCAFRAGRLPEMCRLDQAGREGESIYVEITKA